MGNPESNVGLLSLSDLDVLVTLTTDTGKVLAKLHAVQPKGQIRLVPGIKIAHLALKHRLGKNHKTRIITFVAPWLNQSKRENGGNSQTNGSRNTTSRTAAHAPLLPTPFPIWSSKTAHMVKSGEES